VAKDKVVEMGLDTFGDLTEAVDGEMSTQAQSIRDVIAEGILADQVGVDFFGVGEHHRADLLSPARRWCWPPSPQGRRGSNWVRP